MYNQSGKSKYALGVAESKDQEPGALRVGLVYLLTLTLDYRKRPGENWVYHKFTTESISYK
jgi:hypothetical protein